MIRVAADDAGEVNNQMTLYRDVRGEGQKEV